MARIRTVKPEFWTSEQIVECSTIARLMFIGMWNFCDDAGNHPASFKTLKMEVFPGDDITVSQIEDCVRELIRNDLIVEYDGGNGRRYWHVEGWAHQKIDRPNYKHPSYNPQQNDEQSTSSGQSIDNNSTSDRRQLDDQSPPEGKGKEGKVKERKEETHTTGNSEDKQIPTPAASVCLEIKKIGIIDINPSHPGLLELIDIGATVDEFVHAARTAKDKGKGFSYVLGIVKGQRKEALAMSGKVLHGKIPNKQEALEQRNSTVAQEWVPPEMRKAK